MDDPVVRVGVGIGVCYMHPGLSGLPGLAAAMPQQLGRSSTGLRAGHATWSLRTRSLAAARAVSMFFSPFWAGRMDHLVSALAAGLGVSEKEASDATCENQDLLAGGFGAYPRIAALYWYSGIPGPSVGEVFRLQAEIALLFARMSGRMEHGLACSDLRYLIWNGG